MTDMAPARIAAARSALSRGDLGATRRFATLLLADNPKEAEGHFLLGIVEAGAQRIRAAIDHLQQAVALDARGEYRAHLAKFFALVRQDGDAAANDECKEKNRIPAPLPMTAMMMQTKRY